MGLADVIAVNSGSDAALARLRVSNAVLFAVLESLISAGSVNKEDLLAILVTKQEEFLAKHRENAAEVDLADLGPEDIEDSIDRIRNFEDELQKTFEVYITRISEF